MMKVILVDNVDNVGKLGDQVNVTSGYARNFLIPRGKAVPATKKNIEYFKERRSELENKLFEIFSNAKIRAEKINTMECVTIQSKAGKEGKLFGSVGARDIANAISIAGVKVTKSEVRLRNGPLRTVGRHKVYFQLHKEIFATIIVNIVNKELIN